MRAQLRRAAFLPSQSLHWRLWQRSTRIFGLRRFQLCWCCCFPDNLAKVRSSRRSLFLEVALGGAIAIVVSLLVFSQRAHHLGAETAAQILQRMAQGFPELLAGFTRRLDAIKMRQLQDDLGRSVIAFQEIAAEAKRERLVALGSEPDLGPLSRTLLRLRHDFVIIGRAVTPLPNDIAQRLDSLLSRLGDDVSEFLRGSATALLSRRDAPSMQPAEASLNAYGLACNALRNEGLTRALSNSEVERLFALSFALEHLHHNLIDLARCVREWAGGVGAKSST